MICSKEFFDFIKVLGNSDNTFTGFQIAFDGIARKYDMSVSVTPSGEPYICEDDKLLEIAKQATFENTGYLPEFSAGGGTSDGRFMIHYCPVVEMGVVDATIHKANEYVKIADLSKLSDIYSKFIELYFQD